MQTSLLKSKNTDLAGILNSLASYRYISRVSYTGLVLSITTELPAFNSDLAAYKHLLAVLRVSLLILV